MSELPIEIQDFENAPCSIGPDGRISKVNATLEADGLAAEIDRKLAVERETKSTRGDQRGRQSCSAQALQNDRVLDMMNTTVTRCRADRQRSRFRTRPAGRRRHPQPRRQPRAGRDELRTASSDRSIRAASPSRSPSTATLGLANWIEPDRKCIDPRRGHQPVRVGAKTEDGCSSSGFAGEPIPAIAMGKLFEPFFRGDVRSSRQGLGLGLHIASQIAQAHGGRIDVTSTPDETRFVFRMPLQPI